MVSRREVYHDAAHCHGRLCDEKQAIRSEKTIYPIRVHLVYWSSRTRGLLLRTAVQLGCSGYNMTRDESKTHQLLQDSSSNRLDSAAAAGGSTLYCTQHTGQQQHIAAAGSTTPVHLLAGQHLVTSPQPLSLVPKTTLL